MVVGDGADITNNDEITSVVGDGVRVEGAGLRFENNGTIVAGGDGLAIAGDGYDVVNHKQIKAAGVGLLLDGDGTVLTQNVITGKVAVMVESGMAIIENNNLLRSTSKALATVIGSDEGLQFINTSAVRSNSGIAIQGDAGSDVIDNRGWLEGDVRLGGGDDTFLGSTGGVSGVIRGGGGDDLYVINSSLQVKETAAGGIDTVHSTDSYRLKKNFENLTLLGEDPMTAKGNGLDNVLVGNIGNNRLAGGRGNDTLDGGAGNDRLTGNAGRDVFVFAPGSGTDRIMDFDDGRDRISLAAFEDIETMGDVRDHMVVGRRNAVIEIGEDRLVIVGGADIHFRADDFLF
ncbi:MAG: M10 family metallopeptidase C-terminal domain-containing protein [Rhizobium sp.]|nr:M10 family metallopeptidase C-terminal domain-containing protein [Rhizobium sp.]